MSPPFTRVLVVLNPKAGTAADVGDDVGARVRKAFRERGVEAEVRAPEPAGLVEALSERATEGFDAVVAAGGDGTASAVAQALGPRLPFGVLPLGTHNHFAKDLGGPLDLEPAIDALLRGSVEDLDVAEVRSAPASRGTAGGAPEATGRVFLNFSGIGFHPEVVARRESSDSGGTGRGALATAVAMLRGLTHLPLLRVRLRSSGAPVIRRLTPSVIVCTNPHQMEVFGVEDVSYPERGVLNVYVARTRGPLGLLALILRALVRRLGDARSFETLVLPEVTLEAGRRLLVSIDGEVTAMRTPLHYRIRRRGLRVVRPVAAS